MDDAHPDDDISRIEHAVRSFKRIAEARRFQRALWSETGFELDGSTYVALMTIADAGEIRSSDLAHELWLDVSVISRKVGQLETLGLVTRITDPSDARALLIRPTELGTRTAWRIESVRRRAVHELVESWSGSDRRDFAQLLERFVASAHEFYDTLDP